MTPSEQVVARLQKMSPQDLAKYLTARQESLEKKASALQKAATHLKKAMGLHEKMGGHLDKMGDHIEKLCDHCDGMAEHMHGKSAEATELQKSLKKSIDEATEGIKAIHHDMIDAHEEMADEHDLISGAVEEAADEAAEETDEGIKASEKGGEKVAGSAALRKMQRQHERERKEDQRTFQKALRENQRAILGQFKELTDGLVGGFAKAAETAGAIEKRVEPSRTAVTVDKQHDGTGLAKNANTDPTNQPHNGGAGGGSDSDLKPVLADGVTPNPVYMKKLAAMDEPERQAFLNKSLEKVVPMDPAAGLAALQGIREIKAAVQG